MGNSLCFQQIRNYNPSSSNIIKLIIHDQPTPRFLKPNSKHIAGEIMFEYPDKMVCHADSFFIGQRIPALSINDDLSPGQTYFVLPIDPFACNVLSASSLAVLSSYNNNVDITPCRRSVHRPINFGECPFEYIKGANGRVLIKVLPEFITRLIINKDVGIEEKGDCGDDLLCSTPELKKHYDQLVGSKEQIWSPKLETISEHKIRFSPCRFIGLEFKQKEKEGIKVW